MQMPDIVAPKLANCPPWQLIEQLDYEKDVTGMYMSGHPLDNFKFELKYYSIIPLSEFNAVKAAIEVTPNSKQFRLAGLVIDAQHRMTKTGKKFGVLHLEDFSGKTEFMLWSEEYVKYVNYLEAGRIIVIEGAFKQRFGNGQFEFKMTKMHLLETVKSTLTRQVVIDVEPRFIDEEFVSFIDNNVKNNPGKTSLKFNIIDNSLQKVLTLSTLERGFTLNDEMVEFLNENKQIDISVSTIV